MFVHVVLFWVPPGSPPSVAQQIADDAGRLLAQVPTVKIIEVGRPAMTPREVVDNTYDVGLLTVFTDSDGHDVYQTHPLHLEFVARNKAHFARVQIYDFDSARTA